MLVPEIPLTHQILARLRARFGDRLAVLHSGLTPGERLAQWERLRRGEMPIAVGARSALFAPTRDLGVIVIDEEHDSAYKSEDGFRYHARSLAARRARHEGCPLVLGSATPALETRYAAERGRIRRLRLEHRIASRPLPAVEVVDLARERAALPRGRKLVLSPPLLRALRETLAAGAQSILFLNRRGFSTQIACVDCQHVARCKHCDIALTYHARANALRCHYCDWQTPPPEHCPGCGSEKSALLGIGTERVEEEVRAHFPDARVARLDRDTAVLRGTVETVLRAARGAARSTCWSARRWWPRATTSPACAGRRGERRPRPAPAGLPRRRAHLPAAHPGGRPRRPRRAAGPRDPADLGARPLRDPARSDPRLRALLRRGVRAARTPRYPPFGRLALLRVQASDEGAARDAADAPRRGRRAPRRAGARAARAPRPHRSHACAASIASSCCSRAREPALLRELGRRMLERAERLPRRASVD